MAQKQDQQSCLLSNPEERARARGILVSLGHCGARILLVLLCGPAMRRSPSFQQGMEVTRDGICSRLQEVSQPPCL